MMSNSKNYRFVAVRLIRAVLLCMLCARFGQAQERELADEEVEPVEIPENVEVFEVTTSSTTNRRVPFYLRFPAGFDPDDRNKLHRILFLCPVYNGDGLLVVRGERGNVGLIALADERGWCVLSPPGRFRCAGSAACSVRFSRLNVNTAISGRTIC